MVTEKPIPEIKLESILVISDREGLNVTNVRVLKMSLIELYFHIRKLSLLQSLITTG